MMSHHEPSEVPTSPEIPFPPPLFFVFAGVAGILIEKSFPLFLASGWVRVVLLPAGYLLMACALVVGVWAVVTFVRVRTGIFLHQPAKQLVNYGPYKLSRNPMYSSLTVAYIGLGLVLNSVWMMILLPITLVALYHFIVQREEQYLTSRFRDEYAEYCRRVRRWI